MPTKHLKKSIILQDIAEKQFHPSAATFNQLSDDVICQKLCTGYLQKYYPEYVVAYVN